MPRPTKRDGSTNAYFIKRVPADLADKLKGRRVSFRLPPATLGEADTPVTVTLGNVVKLSLLTTDPSLTRTRHAAISTQVEALFKVERQGPKELSFKAIQALAGLAYAEVIAANEDDPGRAGDWRLYREFVADAGEYLDHEGDGISSPAYDARAAERALRGIFDVDAFLLAHGVALTRPDRGRFVEAVTLALRDASKTLEARASRDYSPDANSAKFPAWVPPAASPSPSTPAKAPSTGNAGVSLTGLVEAWWKEAKATGRKPSTHESYSNTMSRFVKLMGHNDALRITPEDVIRFKDFRLAEINPRTGQPISPKTIKGSDLNGLKVVFGWAVDNRKLPNNPAADVTLKLGKQPKRTREKGFTDEEAKAILAHAFHYKRGQDQARTAAAKRWVPWLCAYTGARVGEIAQLRKQDVRKVGDAWVITITPEAGTVKTNEFREVPLHGHLIEQGFADFVSSCQPGHMFIKPGKTGDATGPAKGLTNRMAEFVREVFHDTRVAPNHGWRHRFKTVAREVRIDQEVRNAIQGHDTKDVASDYGDVTLKTKVDAIAKLPRYVVT